MYEIQTAGGDDTPASPLLLTPPLPQQIAQEAIFERYPSGAAARAKLAERLKDKFPENFYFYIGETLGDPRDGPSNMQFTGCCFRPYSKGIRKGRWLKRIPGTKQSIVVTPQEIERFTQARSDSSTPPLL